MSNENVKTTSGGGLTEQEFLEGLVDLTDTEMELALDTKLDEIEEWDSLSFVAFQARARIRCGKDLQPRQVKEAETVRDLYDLVR